MRKVSVISQNLNIVGKSKFWKNIPIENVPVLTVLQNIFSGADKTAFYLSIGTL